MLSDVHILRKSWLLTETCQCFKIIWECMCFFPVNQFCKNIQKSIGVVSIFDGIYYLNLNETEFKINKIKKKVLLFLLKTTSHF